jgi:hypothetical protein
MTKTSSTESPAKRARLKARPRIDNSSIVVNNEEESEGQGILESFSKLPRTERELIRRLLEKFDADGLGVIRFSIPFGRDKIKDRRSSCCRHYWTASGRLLLQL